ncbi:putative Zn finger-like uncharacterized protein [Desulfobaculum xiamenense]|uniref:Putative Zn finger-like uncharacterized protein n=1 Tax=Desulfobaculum xiamenense TaxID=995050 RepID=A0A846QRB5_9BACT|nr:hypothetical protein [Desulfobaculum xiamenense]NJB69520.1 putative Zn finger-like uncharacterized protein [Desulfobaculum xiamenense]
MLVQCVECQKKYRIKDGVIPLQGADIKCAGGCGQTLRIAPRENLAMDASAIPVNKRKHQKEVKWFTRMGQLVRDWGYERKTLEYNMMFYMLREIRKRLGITFFDIACTTSLVRVDRELRYNCLMFMGASCVPPRGNGVESSIPAVLASIGETLRSHDGSGQFGVRGVMTVPYEDSFPAMFGFARGAQFASSWGEHVYGNVTEVLISGDAARELDDSYDYGKLHEVARVQVSRAPIDSSALTFRQRTAPALLLDAEPDPDLRCEDDEVRGLYKAYGM